MEDFSILMYCGGVELPNSEIGLILQIPVNHLKASVAVLEMSGCRNF